MFKFILPLLGRLHPVLVHLPIGFLLFGVILIFFEKKNSKANQPIIQLALLLGGISAIFACLSGFLHYQNEGYTWDSIQLHLIMGILTAFLSLGFWYLEKRRNSELRILRIKGIGLMLILLVTGHLGGSITHGEEYFTEVMPAELQRFLGAGEDASEPLVLPEENWEEIEFYEGAIQPILNHNCKSCHNSKKLKGELDLTDYQLVLKGGENGEIFEAGKAEDSELFTRLVLENSHDDHMPPKGKRQPAKEEIALIKAWINSGASQISKLGESQVSYEMIEPFIHKIEIPFYPEKEVAKISLDSLATLREKGLYAEQVKENSPWLKISCVNLTDFSDQDWVLLSNVSKNIVYLDLSGTQITTDFLENISKLSNLTVLKLNQTRIEGTELRKLMENIHLKLLYLNGTSITQSQLNGLNEHASLEKVFAYDSPASWEPRKDQFSFYLESGNLSLPDLPSDTIVY
jgi:uncharacterized membrane protein